MSFCSFLPRTVAVRRGQSPPAPPAASVTTAATSHRVPSPAGPDTSIPPIPDCVLSKLNAARRSWIQRCLDAPLVDSATNSRVYVYGTPHFSPLGGASGLTQLQNLLDAVRPTILAIEQPYDIGARSGLPCPDIIHQLTGLFPEHALRLAGPESDRYDLGLQLPLSGGTATGTATASLPEATASERLQALLPGLAQPAKVGRDLLDPFEVFGLYGGCDYVTRPAQMAEALSLFGFLPGIEYAALVVAAQRRDVQVCSVDAALRLQEKWVSQLVAEFSLTEADLARRLQVDLTRAQALLPPEYLAWDVALAEAVRRRESTASASAGVVDGITASGAAGATLPEPPLSAVTAFKVSRAVAAATVPYEESQEAFGLQATLQPLKFALFARRARHLVLQVRDLCQRMSVRQVRVDASKFKKAAPCVPAGNVGSVSGVGRRGEASPENVELVDMSDQPEKVVLVVLGRQYMPYIEELWANGRSVLWHGDVPRTFARSMLEQRGRL